MHLLVGLGNPGAQYERNRHNIGFLAVDEIARRHNFGPFRQKFNGLISEGNIDGEKVLLLKPQTFMNRSGESVGPAAHFHKVGVQDVVVVHDDLDLDFGAVRIKQGGGHGGHNGLRSLIANLGSPDFLRVRVGIGRPSGGREVTGYVLGGFDPAEAQELPEVLERAADALRCVLQQRDPRVCMNEFNRRAEVGSA